MSALAIPPLDTPPSEAFSVLHDLARGKTGPIPPDLLARHVLSVAADAGWPVQRAAMEAILRRVTAAKQDRLSVASAPRGRRGHYTTRREDARERPYVTVVEGIDPMRASCDCRDFVRNSLGLCKHVLTVVAETLASRRKLRCSASAVPTSRPRLEWDPIRPLTGSADWLERLRLVRVPGANGSLDGLHRRFDEAGALEAIPTTPADRHALVEDLWDAARRGSLAADAAILALLRHERERWGAVLRTRPSPAEIRRGLRTLVRPLYPYQEEGVRRFLASGRLLIADDMGLGKTAQAIAASHVLFRLRRVARGLLIVPASLKDQWQHEWRLFSDVPLAAVEGPPDDRSRAYRKTPRGFLVTNYEQVLRDLDLIQRWAPELVVLDEAQRIKNWATKTAAYVKALTPDYRLVLTGTPMENRLEELASLLDWVDDMALEPKWRLVPFHAQYADGRREVVGARHLDTLRARLAPCLLRRGRGEVISQLPSRTDTVVPVAITEAQAEAHAGLDGPIARILGAARKRPLTQAEFLRLMSLLAMQRMIANGMALFQFQEVWPAFSRVRRPDETRLRELGSPKLGHLREILAQVVVHQERKAVVFSQWRRMLTLAHWAVSDVLEDAGLRAVFFTGAEAGRRRTQNIVEFHDEPKTRVLFASDAGGVGLNLQRAASCCVNLELPWNPAVLEQRVGRIYRLGQRRPIEVYNLVTEDSIEARIAGLVSDKKAFFASLFDGDTNEVRFERSASFISRLERIVEPARAPQPAADAPVDEGSAEREVDRLLAAAEDAGATVVSEADTPKALATGLPGAPPATDVRALLSKLAIKRRDDGGLAIEAPPEAADGLAALFEGMASLLRQAGAGR
jgi:superfamily II DNA or RNA helicase